MDIFNTDFEKTNIYDCSFNNINNINNNNIIYIVVLAGGVKENGLVNDFVLKRLDYAIKLYNKFNNNCKIICLGGGTYHKPPVLNNTKYVIHESTSCAKYLFSKNIPASAIYREWASYDTIGNGYYFYTNYVIPLNIKNIYIITSDFHIKRTKIIFNFFNNIFKTSLNINYISTENYNMNENTLKIRRERENNSSDIFTKNIVNKINTVQDFSIWFYTQHNAYKSIINYTNNNYINKTY